MYWEAKNAKGGVAGKYKVDLSIEDSQYQVETALQSYDTIKGDVVAFQQILGTQIVKSVNPRLKADNGFGAPGLARGRVGEAAEPHARSARRTRSRRRTASTGT